MKKRPKRLQRKWPVALGHLNTLSPERLRSLNSSDHTEGDSEGKQPFPSIALARVAHRCSGLTNREMSKTPDLDGRSQQSTPALGVDDQSYELSSVSEYSMSPGSAGFKHERCRRAKSRGVTTEVAYVDALFLTSFPSVLRSTRNSASALIIRSSSFSPS
jgi:hypothetical protein